VIYKFKNQEWFDGIERPNFFEHSGNLLIYGAGFQGMLVVHILEKMDIKILGFLDKDTSKQGTTYQGYPVYAPQEGKHKYPSATVICTPFSNKWAYSYVCDVLEFENVYTPFSLFLEFDYTGFNEREQLPEWYLNELSVSDGALPYHIDIYMMRLSNFYSVMLNRSNKKYKFDLMVTEKCTLRCKECHTLTPFNESPRHFDIERLKRSVDVFCKDRQVYVMMLLGGETFSYPHLKEIIEYSLTKPIERILIVTNGTILPSEDLLTVLENPKITVRFTNYGANSKRLNEFVGECNKRGINHIIMEQQWYKFRAIPLNPHSKERVREIASFCCRLDVMSTVYVKNGMMSPCSFAAQNRTIGIFPVGDDDAIDLLSDEDGLQKKIEAALVNPQPISACYYCNGWGLDSEKVPVGEQLPAGVIPKIARA
jgi:hypothetical protein